MPSKTERQHRFMAMCAHSKGRAWAKENQVKCPPLKVALEFLAADLRRKERRNKKKGKARKA